MDQLHEELREPLVISQEDDHECDMEGKGFGLYMLTYLEFVVH